MLKKGVRGKFPGGGSGRVPCGFTRFFARQQRETSDWKFSKVYLNWCRGCGIPLRVHRSIYIYIYIKRRRGEREKNPPVKITNWYLHQIWKIEYIVQRDGKKSRENLLKKGGEARKQRYSGKERGYFWDGNVWTKGNADSDRWPEVVSRYVSRVRRSFERESTLGY